MIIQKKYKTIDDALVAVEKLGGTSLIGKSPVISKIPIQTYDFIPGLWYASLRLFGYKPKKYMVTYDTSTEDKK